MPRRGLPPVAGPAMGLRGSSRERWTPRRGFAVLLLCLAPAWGAPAPPSPPASVRQAEPAPPPAAAPPAPTREPPPPAPPQPTVRIGLHTPMSNAGFFVAMERGYVAEQGITFEIEPMDTAA